MKCHPRDPLVQHHAALSIMNLAFNSGAITVPPTACSRWDLVCCTVRCLTLARPAASRALGPRAEPCSVYGGRSGAAAAASDAQLRRRPWRAGVCLRCTSEPRPSRCDRAVWLSGPPAVHSLFVLCLCLCRCAAASTDAAREIASAIGGVGLVIDALRRFGNRSRVVQRACWALLSLAARNGTPPAC